MLFLGIFNTFKILGTKKYPEEGTYQQVVTKYGGSTNAFTDNEVTNYHFDVLSQNFEEVLDMFAQFFIEPLFTETATERELNAVHSEHTKNLHNDSW
jgi:insulysin